MVSFLDLVLGGIRQGNVANKSHGLSIRVTRVKTIGVRKGKVRRVPKESLARTLVERNKIPPEKSLWSYS